MTFIGHQKDMILTLLQYLLLRLLDLMGLKINDLVLPFSPLEITSVIGLVDTESDTRLIEDSLK